MDNVQSLFSVKHVPWHKKGIILNNPPNSADAIKLAGLDWTVEKHPTRYVTDDGLDLGPVPNLFAMVRQDNKVVLGTVSRQFEPLQNSEAFEFFDPMIVEGMAVYQTAGALGKGETIWILAELPNKVRIGKDDDLKQFLLLCNGHEGSTNLLVQPTDVRVVCQNTLMASLGSGHVVKIRHTPSMRQNMVSIRENIYKLVNEHGRLFEVYEAMARCTINDNDTTTFINNIWPLPLDVKADGLAIKIWKRRTEVIENLLATGQGTEKTWLRGTVWWLYNAVVEFVDHYAGQRARDLTSYVLRGDGANLKERAFRAAVTLTETIQGRSFGKEFDTVLLKKTQPEGV